MIKKIIFAFVCLFSIEAAAAEFTARLNRNPVPQGETVVLTLEYDDKTSETPDLNVLEKDFDIFSVSNSFRSNFVNGQMSNSLQWTLVLMPKSNGKIIIPSVSLGASATKPLELEVVPADMAEKAASRQSAPAAEVSRPKYGIKGVLENYSPYVQQQVNYQLKIYDSGGLQGKEPYLLADDNDWIVKSLGQPQVETKNIDGRNLREITFNYALFPQKSGKLKLPRFKFEGFYLSKSSRRAVDPFADMFGQDLMLTGFGLSDMFAVRNPVVLITDEAEIEVLPITEQSRGKWWLPAEQASLLASFEDKNPRFKAGEAFTRTIFLKAVGVLDKQLPEINFPQIPGMKQYPEKPQLQTRSENGKIISVSKINNVYIPSRAGKITLPGLAVEWFNVNTGKAEQVTLPPQTITVEESSFAEETPPVSNEEPAPRESLTTGDLAENTALRENISAWTTAEISLALAGAFLLGIILSRLLFRLSGKNNKDSAKRSRSSLAGDVLKAAKNNDLKELKNALLLWAAQAFAPAKVTNLQDVISLTGNQNFAREIEKLNTALYGAKKENWDSSEFMQAFRQAEKTPAKGKKTSAILPDLYED